MINRLVSLVLLRQQDRAAENTSIKYRHLRVVRLTWYLSTCIVIAIVVRGKRLWLNLISVMVHSRVKFQCTETISWTYYPIHVRVKTLNAQWILAMHFLRLKSRSMDTTRCMVPFIPLVGHLGKWDGVILRWEHKLLWILVVHFYYFYVVSPRTLMMILIFCLMLVICLLICIMHCAYDSQR